MAKTSRNMIKTMMRNPRRCRISLAPDSLLTFDKAFPLRINKNRTIGNELRQLFLIIGRSAFEQRNWAPRPSLGLGRTHPRSRVPYLPRGHVTDCSKGQLPTGRIQDKSLIFR